MIEDVRLECTDNGGYIVCYTEVTKPPTTAGTDRFANSNYDYKKESFGPEESEKAVGRMNELAKMMKGDHVSEEKPTKIDVV